MARIDVSELMHDPDFVDEIERIRRISRTDHLGNNIIDETLIKAVGSVQAATGKAIQRLPEAERLENLSSFWFQGEIVTGGGTGLYPDVLVFKGRRYQVKTVFDWTNWGQGWCEGLCVAEVPA